jgi:hypothetical protein
MDTDQFKTALEASQRFVTDLPTLAEVEAEIQKLTDAYDDLTHDYMEALEKLERLKVIAPLKRVSRTAQKPYPTRVAVYNYLAANGPTSPAVIKEKLGIRHHTLVQCLTTHKGKLFHNPSYGIWEAIQGASVDVRHISNTSERPTTEQDSSPDTASGSNAGSRRLLVSECHGRESLQG